MFEGRKSLPQPHQPLTSSYEIKHQATLPAKQPSHLLIIRQPSNQSINRSSERTRWRRERSKQTTDTVLEALVEFSLEYRASLSASLLSAVVVVFDFECGASVSQRPRCSSGTARTRAHFLRSFHQATNTHHQPLPPSSRARNVSTRVRLGRDAGRILESQSIS